MKKKLILAIIAVAFAIITVGIIWCFKTNNDENLKKHFENFTADNKSEEQFSLTDTLKLEESIKNVNWFYNEKNSDIVWKFSIDFISNKFTHAMVEYKNFIDTNCDEFQGIFWALKDGNEFYLRVEFGTANLDEYKMNTKYLQDYAKNFQYYEDEYNGYNIITNNLDDYITMYYKLEDGYNIIINLKKESQTDNLEKYKDFYKKFIDTVSIEKYNKSQFEDTIYLNIYPVFSRNVGLPKLYLNSKNVLIGNLKLDLTNYGVSATSYSLPFSVEYDYTVELDEAVEENGKDFIIWCFDNDKKDLVKKGLVENENDKIIEENINNYNFTFYISRIKERPSYCMYEEQDKFYLIRTIAGDYDKLVEKLKMIIK